MNYQPALIIHVSISKSAQGTVCVGALLFSLFLPILLEEGGGGPEN